MSSIISLADQLLVQIRNRILSGIVPASVPIRQDALAAEFGISKIPLREVLARLEEEGLVVNHANRGYFVRPMTSEEFEEVYALRLKLEPGVIALAAERANEADHKVANDIFATLYQVTDEHGDGVGAFNRAFHLALIRPSNQFVTISILERLHILSERYVRKHLEPLGRDERANDEHQEILDAWIARDKKRVSSLAKAHTMKSLIDLRQQLKASPR